MIIYFTCEQADASWFEHCAYRIEISLHLLPHHINDEQFVNRVLEELLSVLSDLDRAARVGDDSPPRSFADR